MERRITPANELNIVIKEECYTLIWNYGTKTDTKEMVGEDIKDYFLSNAPDSWPDFVVPLVVGARVMSARSVFLGLAP